METARRSLRTVLAVVAVTMMVGGCGVSNALDGRDAEIVRLKYALIEQQGARAAELAYAERQVGIYRGCTLLFNICSDTTTEVGQALIKKGFSGDSSLWWWVPFIGMLMGAGGFLGALLWLPWHLFVRFTGPEKTKIDAARKFMSGLNEKVNAANRKRTQTEQETSAMRRELSHMTFTVAEQRNELSETNMAFTSARATLREAKEELAEVSRLRESFKRF